MQITKTCNYDCGVFPTLYVIIRILHRLVHGIKKFFLYFNAECSCTFGPTPCCMWISRFLSKKKIKVWNWIDLKDQADRGGPPGSSSLQMPEGPFQGFQLHTIYLNSGFRPRITLVKCAVKCWVHSLIWVFLLEKFDKKIKKKKSCSTYLTVSKRLVSSPTNKPFSKIGFDWHSMKCAARWEGFQYSISWRPGNDEYKLTPLDFRVCAPYDLLQCLPYFIFFSFRGWGN